MDEHPQIGTSNNLARSLADGPGCCIGEPPLHHNPFAILPPRHASFDQAEMSSLARRILIASIMEEYNRDSWETLIERQSFLIYVLCAWRKCFTAYWPLLLGLPRTVWYFPQRGHLLSKFSIHVAAGRLTIPSGYSSFVWRDMSGSRRISLTSLKPTGLCLKV
jgi:hypothetical protein